MISLSGVQECIIQQESDIQSSNLNDMMTSYTN